MKKMIVVTGESQTGKTTFANALVEKLPIAQRIETSSVIIDNAYEVLTTTPEEEILDAGFATERDKVKEQLDGIGSLIRNDTSEYTLIRYLTREKTKHRELLFNIGCAITSKSSTYLVDSVINTDNMYVIVSGCRREREITALVQKYGPQNLIVVKLYSETPCMYGERAVFSSTVCHSGLSVVHSKTVEENLGVFSAVLKAVSTIAQAEV